ncbi:unnamed protein product [Caenorhabditis nigoni]
MKYLPSLTVILFICITLNVVRTKDEPNGCQETVNRFRKKAGLGELKEDKEARADLIEKVTRTCLTEDQVKNGIDGFIVARFKETEEPPKSILAPEVKTFVSIWGPRDCPGDTCFVFMKNGVAGKNSESKNEIASSSDTSKNPSSTTYYIGKWFHIGAILAIYKLF